MPNHHRQFITGNSFEAFGSVPLASVPFASVPLRLRYRLFHHRQIITVYLTANAPRSVGNAVPLGVVGTDLSSVAFSVAGSGFSSVAYL